MNRKKVIKAKQKMRNICKYNRDEWVKVCKRWRMVTYALDMRWKKRAYECHNKTLT